MCTSCINHSGDSCIIHPHTLSYTKKSSDSDEEEENEAAGAGAGAGGGLLTDSVSDLVARTRVRKRETSRMRRDV